MNLYLLRHGIAVERGTPGLDKDADRSLTPKGERRLWRITEAMEALKLSFDLILSSPYLRARQTAEIGRVTKRKCRGLGDARCQRVVGTLQRAPCVHGVRRARGCLV